ncbi:MAG: hypothetical protein Q9162_007820 [Coniocarpon cinnabarinum]
MEPLRFTHFPTNHLGLPLRRDLLHRAIVYEASRSRQGTASTKWRDEVHGSHRKLYPQKGLGRARVGDKQSPIRRGGGVAFGPKPRDFSLSLPRKIYDRAFRTALSHRFQRSELLIVDAFRNPPAYNPSYMSDMFATNRWGRTDGRSLLVARERGGDNETLFRGVEGMNREGRIVDLGKCDVKMLLEMGRVIVEEGALREVLRRHSKDLRSSVKRSSVQSRSALNGSDGVSAEVEEMIDEDEDDDDDDDGEPELDEDAVIAEERTAVRTDI